MKRNQKMGITGLFIVGLFSISPIFQNCAQVNYDTFSNVGILGAGGSRKLTIDPTYNQEKANLKVLFVVDDSYTMSQSQLQLANAIDSLLNPLQGHNVDLKIVSTSGVPNNEVDFNISTRYMTEARLTIPQSQTSSLSSYLVEKNVANNSNIRHGTLKLYRSSTTAQFNALKNQIKSSILAVGVNGSDTEEGLCSTARQLFDESSTSFFKTGDKAAIVILTDENDSSLFSKCVTRYIQRVASQPVVYYNYGQQRARVTLEYQLTRDGVTDWYPVVWGVPLNGAQTISNGNTCSTANLNYAVNRITSQGYVIRNVSGCIYETVPASYYGADLGDNGSDLTKNLCSQQVIFNNTAYTNLYTMVNSIGLSAQPGSCAKLVLPGNTLSNSIEYDSVIKSDVASTNAQNLNYAIKNRAIQLFGSSGFTVASLIRKYGESCTLSAGQTYGVAYEGLATLLGPTNSVTASLCASNFSSTLAQVSNYIVTEASSSYVITGLQPTESVIGVKVLRGTQSISLSLSEYEVVGTTLTITNFTLQSGDRLEVQISTL
ncbi:MAG: hypothetical protein ABL930_06280 [Pseudobdellovibrio sp.]